jgi:hypothetical protein
MKAIMQTFYCEEVWSLHVKYSRLCLQTLVIKFKSNPGAASEGQGRNKLFFLMVLKKSEYYVSKKFLNFFKLIGAIFYLLNLF